MLRQGCKNFTRVAWLKDNCTGINTGKKIFACEKNHDIMYHVIGNSYLATGNELFEFWRFVAVTDLMLHNDVKYLQRRILSDEMMQARCRQQD
jgi:hypothetical protein